MHRCTGFLKAVTESDFGEDIQKMCEEDPLCMVSCLRDDVYDEDDILVEKAPKVYEAGGSLTQVKPNNRQRRAPTQLEYNCWMVIHHTDVRVGEEQKDDD